MIRVLVVDDSAFMRKALATMLTGDPEIEVVGNARNGEEALELVRQLDPDVVTMDVDMPVMDGITAVRRIMAEAPRPILMVSSLTREGAEETLAAMEAGAVDFIPKALSRVSLEIVHIEAELRAKVKAVTRRRALKVSAAPRHPAPAPSIGPKGVELIAIGVSTGGPPAVQRILAALPAQFPAPILIAQHMPRAFTGPFAQRLDATSALTVREAEDGMPLAPGLVLVGPGGLHLRVRRQGLRLHAEVGQEPQDALYKPSATELIASVARTCAGRAAALIMTGMGSDGLEGARRLKAAGGVVLAQSEATCTVYGMPKAVVDAGLADAVLDLDAIAETLVRLTDRSSSSFQPVRSVHG
ncbi:MAG: chemotaxis response regulator protein-glutamate methylesterase [Desulfomicrobiaceae bacterium]|nr:chemotaxis response regulator protein-glutamate methylesterase [Desulfomicrobiaceae bacterium]